MSQACSLLRALELGLVAPGSLSIRQDFSPLFCFWCLRRQGLCPPNASRDSRPRSAGNARHEPGRGFGGDISDVPLVRSLLSCSIPFVMCNKEKLAFRLVIINNSAGFGLWCVLPVPIISLLGHHSLLDRPSLIFVSSSTCPLDTLVPVY